MGNSHFINYLTIKYFKNHLSQNKPPENSKHLAKVSMLIPDDSRPPIPVILGHPC